jgi:hypothetical protein
VELRERLNEGQAIVLPAARADEGDEVPRGRIERPMDHPPTIASADHDLPLLPPLGPTRPQRRELAHRRLIAEPDFSARCHDGCRLLCHGFFLRRQSLVDRRSTHRDERFFVAEYIDTFQ